MATAAHLVKMTCMYAGNIISSS